MLESLKGRLHSEERTLKNLRESLHDFQPTDTSGWTHYDYKNFQPITRADLRTTIARVQGRVDYLKGQIAEAEREARREDGEEDLIY